MFLVNSWLGNFNCGPTCVGRTLSRSYGRFFAEFLGDLSLVRLGLLDLNTCVGLRYGFSLLKFIDFYWEVIDNSIKPKTKEKSSGFRSYSGPSVAVSARNV